MIRPKPEEVTRYAEQIGFKLNGNHFCDYYESKGWLVGKTPMKNWQAAVRTWKHNSPASALIGQKYDHAKFERASTRLEDLKEREWLRRHPEEA